MPRFLSLASLLFVGSAHAFAMPTVEERLRAKLEDHHVSASALAPTLDWRITATQLLAQAPATTPTCVEANRQIVAGTYVLTRDVAGRPCRLYDLAFPAIKSAVNVGRLPLQTFGARDYLDWLEGRYDQVLGRMNDFRAGQTVTAEWASALRFKTAFAARERVPGTTLPRAFRASDLETPSLAWSANDRALLARLAEGAWADIVARPEAMLEKIQFNWNDLEKVYEIAVDGQFLLLNGPIVLVDFDRPYRLAVQTLLRSVLHSALGDVLKYVPPPARSIITVAVDDGFEFVQMAYDYQLNRLEQTLTHDGTLDAALNVRAQNILAGGRADFYTEYIKSVVLKQPFDWARFEDIGRTLRYDARRHRDVMMSKLNSRMVLEDGCAMTLVYDYFGNCAKGGATRLHTMISDLPILMWNLGAPVVQDPAQPAMVSMRRGAAYLLSVGSRLVELPYLGFLMPKLTQIAKQFAFAGVVDEGFLRGQLRAQQQAGHETPAEAELSRWLYVQNLNAFLAKSKEGEDAIIKATLTEVP